MSKPSSTAEYAFSGSLCNICSFETEDGIRYCLTIFSLSDYRQLHFPHDEYKHLIDKLNMLLSTHEILPDVQKINYCASVLTIKQITSVGDFKIKFGDCRINIGPITTFGLVKVSPFVSVNNFAGRENNFTCNAKWDICTCGKCPVFKRLLSYEEAAKEKYPNRRLENVILFQH